MFIDGIRYTSSDSVKRAYKFPTSSGRHRNIAVFYASSGEIRIFRQAIYFALTGSIQSLVRSVRLHLHDSNGDFWIIHRSDSENRFFKNKEELATGGQAALCQALLDLPANDFVFERPDEKLVGLSKVIWLNQELWVRQQNIEEEAAPAISKWEQKAEQVRSFHFRTVKKYLGIDYEVTTDQLQYINHIIKTHGYEYLHVSETIERLKSRFHFPDDDEQTFDRLSKEIDVLEELKQRFLPLQKNAQYMRMKKERRDKLLEIISSIENDGKVTNGNISVAAYEKSLKLLTRLNAYQVLTGAFRKVVNRFENNVKPTVHHYYETISDFLRNDKLILRELESLLDSLTKNHQLLSEMRDGSGKSTLDRFLERISHRWGASSVEKLETSTQKVSSTVGQDSGSKTDDLVLKDSQDIVNKVLSTLGELHSNLEVVSQSAEWNLNAFYERYERLIKDSAKVRSSWEKAAKIIGVDVDIKIEEFISIMRSRSQYTHLHEELEDLNGSLDSYQRDLKVLVGLLEKWYQITDSYKPKNSNQLSAIFREIRGIIAYIDTKRTKLHEYQSNRHARRMFEQSTDLLHGILENAQKNWEKAFKSLGVIDPSISSDVCDALSHAITSILSFQCLTEAEETSGRRPFSQSLAELSVEVPTTLFDLSGISFDGDGLKLLHSVASAASPHGHGIILTDQENVKDSLHLAGFTVGDAIEISLKDRKTSTTSNSKDRVSSSIKLDSPIEPQMSDKARAVLDIFRHRPS